MMRTKSRMLELDVLKVFGILLVIFGHAIARKVPVGIEWYPYVKNIIYIFHMSLFFFASGVLFSRVHLEHNNFNTAFLFIRSRFSRLIPAYFLFAFFIFFSKYIVSHFIQIDNAPDSIFAIFDIILRPVNSAVGFLWYIYALLVISFFSALFRAAVPKASLFFTAGAICLLFVRGGEFLATQRIFESVIYFALGWLVADRFDLLLLYVKKFGVAFFSLLALFLMEISVTDVTPLNKLITSLLAITSTLWLGSMLHNFSSIIEWWSRRVFTIYLMNTIFIGLAKVFIGLFFEYSSDNFLIYLIMCFGFGLCGPVMVGRLVDSKFPTLSSYIK